MLSDDSPDEDIARAFLRRKGLGPGWLSLAWFAVQDAHRRYDPARGAWLTCARVAIAGAIKNERRRMNTRYAVEIPDDPDRQHSSHATQESTCELHEILLCAESVDCAILDGMMRGLTLREICKDLGFGEDWACRRFRRINAGVKHQSSIERRGPLPLACRGARAKSARKS
jgi:hypothetical protein